VKKTGKNELGKAFLDSFFYTISTNNFKLAKKTKASFLVGKKLFGGY